MFGVASGLLLATGIAFLAVAGWIVLAQVMETLHIALVYAGLFLGLGCIALALAKSQKAETTLARDMAAQADAPQATGMAAISGLSAAFIEGINAGMAAGQTRPAEEDVDPCDRGPRHRDDAQTRERA